MHEVMEIILYYLYEYIIFGDVESKTDSLTYNIFIYILCIPTYILYIYILISSPLDYHAVVYDYTIFNVYEGSPSSKLVLTTIAHVAIVLQYIYTYVTLEKPEHRTLLVV